MKFAELMRGIDGVVAVSGGEVEVGGVSEDSRKVRAGDVFVARGGTKVSGAAFVEAAIAKGAAAVVGETKHEKQQAVAHAQVKDAGLALALMAHRMAGNPTAKMKMLAVTGTKGKTTIAYLLRSIVNAAAGKCAMVGTVEIDDGAEVVGAEMTTPGVVELVDLFGRMEKNGATHCVMEVSSHALHQHRVAGIDFAVGMFTNLTGDHLDYHKTMDRYGAAKAMLFTGLGESAVAVINVDDKYAARMAEGCRAKVVGYGVAKSGEARPAPVGGWLGTIESMGSGGMTLAASSSAGEGFKIHTPLVGRHNAYNLMCVVAAARSLGIDAATIAKALEGNVGAPGRLEPVVPAGTKRGDLPFQVFVDYAHTHDALENVLRALRGTMGKGRLICVFGCGGDRDRTKRPKMAAVAEKLADEVIVTSDNPRTEDPTAIIEEVKKGFSDGINGKVKVEADRRAAIGLAIAAAKKGDVVLIAGKGHEDYQIIGTTKHHFDDVEEAVRAMGARA